jgi:hypothetical protein
MRVSMFVPDLSISCAWVARHAVTKQPGEDSSARIQILPAAAGAGLATAAGGGWRAAGASRNRGEAAAGFQLMAAPARGFESLSGVRPVAL